MISALHQLDDLRRLGGTVLDAVGLGPAETPWETVGAWPGVRLRAYAGPAAEGPTLLIVPAPIKRAYIWDLVPWASVVRRCLDSGMLVHLAEWTPPGPQGHELGLDAYADRLLLHCLDAIAGRTGQRRVLVVSHSLGGTLAAIFAALHPRRVRGLALIEAPLRFGRHAGAFAPLVAAAPDTSLVRASASDVPGSFLSLTSAAAAPATFHWERYADLLASLPDRRALRTHLGVQRWMLDELPLPSRLFEQVVEQLYREDRLMRGELVVGGQRVGPERLEAPLLDVVNPHSRVIPPESILPFHDAARSPRKRLLWSRGERGVALQHVAALVGRSAHRDLWPQILDWLHAMAIPEEGHG